MAAKKKISKKKTAKNTARRKAQVKSTSASPMDLLVEAGLEEAASVGWRHTSMDTIAERANVALGNALILLPTKSHFVSHLLDRVDAQSLTNVTKVERDDTPRDRLFEILMRRFDVLNTHRDAYRSIFSATLRDPGSAALLICQVRRSLMRTLAAAGIDSCGLFGALRVKGLGLVGLYALRAWMKDDSADLSKTMAALDRALKEAERAATFSPFARRGKSEAASD